MTTIVHIEGKLNDESFKKLVTQHGYNTVVNAYPNHMPFIADDFDILNLLKQASHEDLDILVGFLCKPTTSELDLSPVFKHENPNHANKTFGGNHALYINDIAGEIQRYGGHSLVNLFRAGKGVKYAEILSDVADQMKCKYPKDASVEEIENALIAQMIAKSYESASAAEKIEIAKSLGMDGAKAPSSLTTAAIQMALRAGGFTSYKLAVSVAHAVAKAILGRGLSFTASNQLTKGLSVFIGPIGLALTAIWTIVDLAGPAYRVTIPCVLHIAYMRLKSKLIECPHCHDFSDKETKYCASCGHQLIKPITCAKCSTELKATDKFCTECGTERQL